MRPNPDQILDYGEYPVLYVDDEPENLRIFELTFKREFRVLTATSGERGLELLASEPIALVLSDHKMPGMLGTEFLARAAEFDPNTVRILVTAYGDAKTLGDAINSGSIYKFVPKPWRPDEMRLTLRRAIEAYALDREREQLVRELSILNQAAKALGQELELDPLMRLLLDTLTEDIGYDGATVLMLDATGRTLRPTYFSDPDSELSQTLRNVEISDANARDFMDVMREGRAEILRSDDVGELTEGLRTWLTELAADEVVALPLIGKSGMLGVLAVDNRRGGRPFGGDDQTLLEGVTHQAVIAISNARLISDLRKSREQTRRADRLGTLGTLAAGLAHEINNPLVSIHTFLSLAPEKRENDDPDFWVDFHALACREVDRIKRLVETMRSLGRDTSSIPREPLMASELVEEVTALVARELERARVDLVTECDADTPKLVAVRDHMHQLMMNLVLNALHATPPNGEIQLRIRRAEDGASVRIEVTDTGPGIPDEELAQIFDPFFTTKEPNEGTGLGLMICHRIVQSHRGSIQVQSEKGQGTTFTVILPAGDDLAHSSDA